MAAKSFNNLFVELGSKSFLGEDGRWPEHIGKKLNDTLSSEAKRARDNIERMCQELYLYLEEIHSSPWNGMLINDTDQLQRRSGEGLASIRASIKVSGTKLEDLQGTMSTGLLTIHETGGVIYPTNAKYLTIPLPAALDRRGVPLKERARDWPDTFVQNSKRGNLIIFQKQKDGSIIPLYLLKSSVYIKPRLHMEETWTNYALPRFEKWIVEDLETLFDKLTF